ncbi:MAG TPA: LiaF domain-containing protein [Kofleriaceae bacterium]|nr:LiaF domain-containing protein [Kofleriaceae bacterium]
MRHLGSRFGLGLVVLVIGALLLFEIVAGLSFPIVRTVIAVLFVLIGGRMIVRAWARRGQDGVSAEAVLARRNFSHAGALDHDARFDVLFGSGTVDLTGLVEPEHDVTVTIETLFGHALVKLPPALAYDVEGNSAFGEVRMPDRTATAMGSLVYRAASDHPSRLHLRVNAVFGACQLVEAEPAA